MVVVYVDVSFQGRLSRDLRLLIVEGDYDYVFGRERRHESHFNIDYSSPVIMFNVNLKENAKPIFCRHRNIVYAL